MSSHTGKPDARAVHAGREDLKEGPVLIRQDGLEVDRELELGNRRDHMFPVISGSDVRGAAKLLGSLKDIGPEMNGGDLPASDMSDRRPVPRIDQHSFAEPIGDVLLTELSATPGATRGLCREEITNALGQPLLTTGDFDRSTKGDNVLLFRHDAARYTNRFVDVNKPVCMTDHKTACIVLPMSMKQKKKPKPASIRVQLPGFDGKVLGQRIREAMAYHAGRVGGPYEQKDLVRDVMQRRRMHAKEEHNVQSTISAAMRITNECKYLGTIAAVCEVDYDWLASGAGDMLPR